MAMDDCPPGFRFYPTEEELVSFYLPNKLQGNNIDTDSVIPVVNIYHIEPWDLPRLSGLLCRADKEQWFFFVPRQEREARGGRTTRTTATGYWKATGTPGYVYSSDNKEIGLKKTMVFYIGKAPSGRKTKWKMHEYRAIERAPGSNVPRLRTEFTLCRVYIVSGSFRAFDRRPMEPVAVEAQRAPAEAATQAEAGPVEPPESTGSSGGEAMSSLLQPFWDLEQLDWL